MVSAIPWARTGGRPVPLALRNLLANKRRLIRSSAGIGFAVLLMLVQLGFERGFFEAALATVTALDGDLFIMNASKYRFGSRDPFPSRDLIPARAVAGVAGVTPLYGAWQDFFWQPPGSDQPYLVQAFGFDPAHPPFLLPDIEAESARLAAPATVLVDRDARRFLGMEEAQGQATINGHSVQIVGSFALGPDFISDGTAMMSAATFAAVATGGRVPASEMPVEFGVVKLRKGADAARVQQALTAALPAGLRIMTKPQLVDFERKFQSDLSSAGPIFWLGTLVGFVVGMLISYQIVYTDLSDQLPQYATLKGMGYETRYLVRLVLTQASLSAVAGWLPAWLFGLLVYWVIGRVALLPMQMTWQITLISLGLTLAMCLLSAALAIRRVVAADPAEVF